VSWTPTPDSFLDGSVGGRVLRDHVRSTTLRATTGGDGRFVFTDDPTMIAGVPSALWVTHVRHQARAIPIGVDREGWVNGLDWELSDAASVSARVVDGLDEPIADAKVEQVGSPPATSSERLASFLLRDVRTDDSGTARLFPVDSIVEVTARHGENASAPWIGELDGTITLSIAPGFVAGGGLSWDPAISGSTRVTVRCEALDPLGPVAIGSADVSGSSWGPRQLPLTGAVEYRFRLEADGVVPVEHMIPAPRAGDTIELGFDVEAGHTIWFLVTDPDKNPLFEAEAHVGWQQGGRRVERVARVRDDGYLPVFGCASGEVRARFRCPGYARMAIEGIELPLPMEGVFPIVLSPACTLRGRVTLEGEPVEDFDVVAWPSGNRRLAERFPFRGRSSGGFEFSELPPGRHSVVATAPGLGQDLPVLVESTLGRVTEVNLALQRGSVAVGQVVDAATGAPLERARVRTLVTDGIEPVGLEGAPVPVDADGRFRLPGVTATAPAVAADAPGYSTRQVTTARREAGLLDLGRIELDPRQAVEVRILAGPETDPATLSLRVFAADGGDRGAEFGAEGIVRLESMTAGLSEFVVDFPGGLSRHEWANLVPGEEWLVEIDCTGSATLRVRARDANGDPFPEGGQVVARELTGRGDRTVYAVLDADGRATIRGLQPNEYQVELLTAPDLGAAVVAARRVRLAGGDDVDVELREGEDVRYLRIVDKDGAPVRGVLVTVNRVGAPYPWSADAPTDADGVCSVRGPGDGDWLVQLDHPELGFRMDVPVHVSGAEPSRVTFVRGTTVEVVLERAAGPAAGVQAVLRNTLRTHSIRGPRSDEHGRVVWDSVAPGEYIVEVRDDRYWPTGTTIRVDDSGNVPSLRVYRLCTLDVTATVVGVGTEDVELHLQRIGGETPLADLVRSGHVASSTGSMQTGDNGRLRLEGVAEGSYVWTAIAPTGEVAEGGCEVQSDRENRLAARL
jgi:hypothetical protein